MTQAFQIADDHTASPLRALHSFTPAQADQIVAGLSSLAAAWTIERHESCDGQLSIVLMRHGCDTTLVVDRDAGGIHVSFLIGDKLQTAFKRHTSIASVVAALKALAGKNSAAMRQATA